jgi:tetratricopeptide (TPR) repeat protein
MNNLAAAYQADGRLVESIALHEEVLAARKETLGPEHPGVANTLASLADAYRQAGRLDVAIAMLRQAVAIRKEKLTRGHGDTTNVLNQLGSACLQAGRFAEAEPVLRECLALREEKDPDDWGRFQTMGQLGAALAGQKKYAEAERPSVDGVEGLLDREKRIPPRRKGELADASARIPPLYESLGRPAEAARWRRRLAAITDGLSP